MSAYPELFNHLLEKGFAAHEAHKLIEYWRGWWAVLFMSSADEIRKASRFCLK
jgi:hypothetical protein